MSGPSLGRAGARTGGPAAPAVRKATLRDAEPIHALIRHWAQKNVLLARSISDICDNLRDFFVAERDGTVVGCGALHITWLDLAEIRSVAVAEGCQGQGIGAAIVCSCLEEARLLGIPRVFVLTYAPDFFAHFGFRQVPKESFPHKIWTVCINCPHFPHCEEVAMAVELGPPPAQAPAAGTDPTAAEEAMPPAGAPQGEERLF